MKWIKCCSIGNLIIHYLANTVMTLSKCEYWTGKVLVRRAGNEHEWQLCCAEAPQRTHRIENRNSTFDQIILLKQNFSASRGWKVRRKTPREVPWLVCHVFLWESKGPQTRHISSNAHWWTDHVDSSFPSTPLVGKNMNQSFHHRNAKHGVEYEKYAEEVCMKHSAVYKCR